MTINEQIEYWIEIADNDLKASVALFETGNYI